MVKGDGNMPAPFMLPKLEKFHGSIFAGEGMGHVNSTELEVSVISAHSLA